MNGADDLLSQADAARELGLTRARVAQLIAAGALPAVERQVTERAIRRADLDAFRARRRRPGRPRTAPAGEQEQSRPDGARPS